MIKVMRKYVFIHQRDLQVDQGDMQYQLQDLRRAGIMYLACRTNQPEFLQHIAQTQKLHWVGCATAEIKRQQ